MSVVLCVGCVFGNENAVLPAFADASSEANSSRAASFPEMAASHAAISGNFLEGGNPLTRRASAIPEPQQRPGPFPFRSNRNGAPDSCCDAFSSREPGPLRWKTLYAGFPAMPTSARLNGTGPSDRNHDGLKGPVFARRRDLQHPLIIAADRLNAQGPHGLHDRRRDGASMLGHRLPIKFRPSGRRH